MFDTMTITKAVGGLCGTFLVFLLGGWAAELIYHGGGGHDDHHEQAYVIEVESEGEDVAVEEGPSFEEVYAMADAAAGESKFRPCTACHVLEQGENGVGPYLYGVVGRDIGSAEGYDAYSGALSQVAEVWTPENLNGFLENPSAWAPGTSMNYNGLRKIEDRADLIAYLDSIDD
ncbi:c-type cytochrome [Yoonia sp. 208BN28-4]|uniref:c-type cytochrome n=1 Tax=Yoonia sp. 208BN28-4 TaxID=3126505 RepID=UPI0030B11A5F